MALSVLVDLSKKSRLWLSDGRTLLSIASVAHYKIRRASCESNEEEGCDFVFQQFRVTLREGERYVILNLGRNRASSLPLPV